MDYTEDKILALQSKAPLREMEIAGRVYPLGDLSDEQIVEYCALGQRLVDGTATDADRNPRHVVLMVLWAGDKSLDLRTIYDHITREHVLAAGDEVMRQVLMRTLTTRHRGSA